jgi:hypothetical protein
VDPLENPRADWLGVRTVQGNAGRAAPILRDGATERASTQEPSPPPLPLVLKIGVPSALPNSPGPQAPEPEPMAQPTPAAEVTAAPVPPAHGQVIALEYADDPVLQGRPRLGADGAMSPGLPSSVDVERYGPEPTYPAAYYAGGTAPTSVPRSRELWPVAQPWHPTVLPRVWRRIRAALGGGSAPASPSSPSAVVKARHVAERG